MAEFGTPHRPSEGWEERLLAETAAAVAYPATPDIRGAVLATLAVYPEQHAPAPLRLRMAAAALAAVALLVALALAIEPARTAVAEFFGLVEGSRIERLPEPASFGHEVARPARALLPTPVPLREYAVRVTLEEARGWMDYEPGFPSGAGELQGVYLVLLGNNPLLILQYRDLDLWQSRGTDFIGKGLGQNAIVETPEVNGRPAYWIESEGHRMRILDAEGREVLGSRRTVDRNALIWRGEETFYRMETELSLEEALGVAETLP